MAGGGTGGGAGWRDGSGRADSLIATKILAACPPGALDGLSSLEDSMMENDISGTTADSAAGEGSEEGRAGGYGSMDEGADDGGAAGTSPAIHSLEDGSAAGQISPTPPDNDRQPGTTVSFKKNGDRDGSSSSPADPPWRTPRHPPGNDSSGALVTFSDFDNLGALGSGAFADVYKVRSKGRDRRLYAIKRTRRQFRGVKDRERAMAEVHIMKRLQNALLSEAAAGGRADAGGDGGKSRGGNHGLYLLVFIRAWQQDGFFYCQTELCSRATCRHLRLSLTSDWERDVARYPSLRMCLEGDAASADAGDGAPDGAARTGDGRRLLPEPTVWQVCHDISRGLSHIHSHSVVHYDIKPSNIFFVLNSRWGGTICKIGDFGLAGEAGAGDDGQEGDAAYMPAEALGTSAARHPGADVFSLGLTLHELAAGPGWSLPREGEGWHGMRDGGRRPGLPEGRSDCLAGLIGAMTRPGAAERPRAADIAGLAGARRADDPGDGFLSRYVNDVERHDSRREREMESAEEEARRRSSTPTASMFNHHALGRDTVARRAAPNVRTPTNTSADSSAFFR